MAKETLNNIRLGLFISSGVLILIVSLYLIGKNQSFFGANFQVRARFNNISGLLAGNNVRYSGIQAGTVDKIEVINDTTIEVTLLLDKKMRPFIHENSFVAIGNDGLMGNKVINIAPNPVPAPNISEKGLLLTRTLPNTDEMMQTLSNTNNNIETISENLKSAVIRLNNSRTFWNILSDSNLHKDLSASMRNIRETAIRINTLSAVLNTIVADIHNGKGTAGMLLNDEKAAGDMKQAIENINNAAKASGIVINRIDSLMKDVQHDISHGHGAANAILNDTAIVNRLNNSMQSIEKGTESFNQNMEALKHNILTRGYFRKEAKRKKKAGK